MKQRMMTGTQTKTENKQEIEMKVEVLAGQVWEHRVEVRPENGGPIEVEADHYFIMFVGPTRSGTTVEICNVYHRSRNGSSEKFFPRFLSDFPDEGWFLVSQPVAGFDPLGHLLGLHAAKPEALEESTA